MHSTRAFFLFLFANCMRLSFNFLMVKLFYTVFAYEILGFPQERTKIVFFSKKVGFFSSFLHGKKQKIWCQMRIKW